MKKVKSAVKKLVKAGKVVNCSDPNAQATLEKLFNEKCGGINCSAEELLDKSLKEYLDSQNAAKEKKKAKKKEKKAQLNKLTKKVEALESKVESLSKDLKDILELMEKVTSVINDLNVKPEASDTIKESDENVPGN